MASGVEIAGLVLATLPICVEIAKAYCRGANTVFDVVLHSRRDDKLLQFYEDFYWNVSEINKHVQYISTAATGDISSLKSVLSLREWRENPATAEGLHRVFESEISYQQYIVITEKIVKLLYLLLANESLFIDRASTDATAMFSTLQAFMNNQETGRTRSDFAERFRFFRTEKERIKCLELLEKWSDRLYRLVQEIRGSDHSSRGISLSTSRKPWNNLVLSIKNPTAQIRLLTKELYNVLSDSWICACTHHHEARFCLNLHCTEKSFADVEAEFCFFVSSSSSHNSTVYWKEGTVGIRSVASPLNGHELQRVCDALKNSMTAFRLRLLMEEISGQHRLWRLDPKPTALSVSDLEPPVSLCDLLSGHAKMGPYEKRELAVVCAYSLLLLHGSPWMSSKWDKTKLTFFVKPNHEPDFVRPFISTRFESPAQQIGSGDSGAFHRNSHILALGILLLEILNEKPIERWRRNEERAMVSPENEATLDWLVASRVVQKMDRSLSRAAVEACLDLDWIPMDQPAGLEEPEVRNGLFKKVIEPLEAELAMVA